MGWKHQQLLLIAAPLPSWHSEDASGAEASDRSVRKPSTDNTLLRKKETEA